MPNSPNTPPNSNSPPDEKASILRAAAAVTVVLGIVILGGGAVELLLDRRPLPAPDGASGALVPLPPGGEEVAQQRGRNEVTLHYRAPGRAGEVMQFYRVAMVEQGWREVELEDAPFDEGLLAFSRGGETCMMRISEISPGGPAAVTVVVMGGTSGSPFAAPYEEVEP